MRPIALISLALLTLLAVDGARADNPSSQKKVQISATADREQPTGWPLVVEVTLRNSGASAVTWWCGGPDVYPGAGHFAVEVRYEPEREWHSVDATNGQYIAGSGGAGALQPGESIVVPLAIPVKHAGGIWFRITTRDWQATVAEGYIQALDKQEPLDARRARVIAAGMTQSPPFWQHLAERYADDVVIDAMIKLVTVDNAPIVAGAARVLARQKALPASAGDTFAVLIKRWIPREPRIEWGGLREWIANAALKTESESARNAMLNLMAQTRDADTRWIAMDSLRLSTGDAAWLQRVRESIVALRTPEGDTDEFDRQQKLAVEWLDSRLKHLD